MRRDRFNHGPQSGQIGRPVVGAGSTDGQKNQCCVGHGVGNVRGEMQPSTGRGAVNQPGEAGLVNGHFAAAQHGDFFFVDIDARHVIAAFGKARTGDQTNVSGANDGDLHGAVPP